MREKCQICNALQGCKHNVRERGERKRESERERERERKRQDIPEKILGEWGYQGRTRSAGSHAAASIYQPVTVRLKNLGLSPKICKHQVVEPGSHKKLKWKCTRNNVYMIHDDKLKTMNYLNLNIPLKER